MAEKNAKNVGKIVQVIGPVIDVEFEAGQLPEIYNALHVVSDGKSGGAGTAAPASGEPRAQVEYLYEPAPQEIFNQLLPRYVEVQIYRALLESNAAFFAAQMTAMDTATKNSGEMIASLTLYMNKVRQAAITREIIEVVSGAEAL